MKILAIETSCDETAAAVIENGRLVRSNVVWSQLAGSPAIWWGGAGTGRARPFGRNSSGGP